MPLAEGQIFAGYRILRLLGSGSMGNVYLAQHPRLPRQDALKVLAADFSADTEYRARFNREADLASTLYHPHIVGVHDRGEEAGQLWISMDFVDGSDAARLVADRFPTGMPVERVLKIVDAVADALDYAHERGLLHRDVKPANILLTRDSGQQRILLADFGIARELDTVGTLTATNVTLGTIAYASPEQLMGQHLDGRSDQYALAATTYQLLTGTQLFRQSNPAVMISQHLNGTPPRLAETRPDLSSFDPVMSTALAKDPRDRFVSCDAFAYALADAARRPAPRADVARRPAPAETAALPTPPPAPVPTAADSVPALATGGRRTGLRWPLTIGALLVLLVIGAIGYATRPAHHDPVGATTATASTSASASAPVSQTTPVDSAAPAVSFAEMSDLVTGYYRDLPARPMDAWTKLDTGYQQRAGLQDYLDFWAGIRAVTVLSVSPRNTTSVVAQLRYTRPDGSTATESRWLTVADHDGALLIADSGLVG